MQDIDTKIKPKIERVRITIPMSNDKYSVPNAIINVNPFTIKKHVQISAITNLSRLSAIWES